MKRPVIIIGAARSGTKLLRDLLAEHPEISAIPYDINYLWRIGNENAADDCLAPPLPARAIELVTKRFDRLPTETVVEKTVSNCLRIPAIAAAFPDARFVFLTRDGYDVTESAMRQWVAPTDWKYSLRKATQFPWLAAPKYAIEHLRGMVSRSGSDMPQWWGPRYPGIAADMANDPLHVVCAKQWASCNDVALEAFAELPVAPLVVRYEDLAREPLPTVNSIHSHLGMPLISKLNLPVTAKTIGGGVKKLDPAHVDEIAPIIDPTMVRLQA